MTPLTRREFVQRTALLAAITQLGRGALSADAATPVRARAAGDSAALRWLDGAPPALMPGVTWGRPWARGQHARDAQFALQTREGQPVPLQTWPLAFWPDGSLKWTAHAIPANAPRSVDYVLSAAVPAAPAAPVRVQESPDEIALDTGVLQVRLAREGATVFKSVQRDGREVAREAKLVCRLEKRDQPDTRRYEQFESRLSAVTLEQAGPIRAVVKLEGRHVGGGRDWLPFVVRLYFHAGSDQVRMMHTIVFDGDAERDFVAGVGVSVGVPLKGELHDRHVRFSGLGDGVFGEAVRGITGLRRDPGAAVRAAQVAGERTPPTAEWNPQVATRLEFVPAYADWTLVQGTCDGFEIRKRTKEGHTWLEAARGNRAGGLGYLGSPDGGVAFGLRNFWQSYPAQLDIRGATTDLAEVTTWMWAPGADAMDLRPYHDGLGQDTYAKQYNGGLEITYEDYEPGFNSPEGVARTSELNFWFVGATPARETFAQMAQLLAAPPLLVSTPEWLHAAGVFGHTWTPVNHAAPAEQAIEERLAQSFDYYLQQQEERRWYGFWHYGDVMHTYDADRREWRYDVGGYAWDNSELATDIWLWLYFLRSGRADVFRFAEAMTRHTGEVDVHHLGRFAPLGSRHNVQHWGCSAKQLRIATAANRRYYYFLTGDERVGDLMRAQNEAGEALLRIPPGRKLASAAVPGDLARGQADGARKVGMGVGTDWGSLASAWLTEWERTGDTRMRDRLLAGMRTIGAQPAGFFTAGLVMDLDTGAFDRVTDGRMGISHLNAVFGLVEVCAELIQLLDVPEFRRAWLDYCELYNAPADLQRARLGRSFNNNSLTQGHSRLTAYAAHQQKNPELAARAWREFRRGTRPIEVKRVEGPAVLRPVHEAVTVSTNDAAQWGLAAMQCLAWLGTPPD